MHREGKSPDGYVRIPTDALAGVELRHLISEKDTSIAVPGGRATITGISEWVGSWQHRHLSIGWDWALIDGLVVLVNPNEIRTNVQLIARNGAPEPPCVAKIHLFHWIESLPWREGAMHDLLTGDAGRINPR